MKIVWSDIKLVNEEVAKTLYPGVSVFVTDISKIGLRGFLVIPFSKVESAKQAAKELKEEFNG